MFFYSENIETQISKNKNNFQRALKGVLYVFLHCSQEQVLKTGTKQALNNILKTSFRSWEVHEIVGGKEDNKGKKEGKKK